MDNATIFQHAQWLASLDLLPMLVPQIKFVRVESGLMPVCQCFRKEACKSPGKHTLVSWKGVDTPTSAIASIAKSLREAGKHERFNLALRTGRIGGIFAIDIDYKSDGFSGYENWKAFLRDKQIDDPLHYETLTARTGGGGLHLIYPYPKNGEVVKNSVSHPEFNFGLNPADAKESGIDVRGDGGIIIVAPSIHKSGNPYTWLTDPSTSLRPDIPLPILRAVATHPLARDPGAPYSPTREELEKLGENWLKNKKHPSRVQMGRDLLDVLQGKPIHLLSGAHDHFTKINWHIAMKFPRASADSIMEHFTESIEEREKLKPDGSCTVEDVRENLRTALEKTRELEDHWEAKLVRNADKTRVIGCMKNAEDVLNNDIMWEDKFGYNVREGRAYVLNPLPGSITVDIDAKYPRPIRDTDETRVAYYLSQKYQTPFEIHDCRKAVETICHQRPFDPFLNYLNTLPPWDGLKRVDTWLSALASAEDTPINRVFGAIFMLQAVKRTLDPGCQADYTLILEGGQGIGKSTLLRELVPHHSLFDDGLKPIDHTGNKDNLIKLAGPVILELAELGALRKGDVETIKAFLTAREDTYRPPYGTHPVTMPRRCVFAGTTNSTNYLRDTTGNRRFLPVRLPDTRINLTALRAHRDQIWAEALLRVHRGELEGLVYTMTTELAEAVTETQDERKTAEPWADIVDEWLAEAAKILHEVDCVPLQTENKPKLGPDQVTQSPETDEFDVLEGGVTDLPDMSHLDKYVNEPGKEWDEVCRRRYGEKEHFKVDDLFECREVPEAQRTQAARDSIANHLKATGHERVKWRKRDAYHNKHRWLRKIK